MVGHGRNIVVNGSGGVPDARIVEKYDRPMGCEGVDEEGVPVIDCAAEVVEEKDRYSGVRAETAVSEFFAFAVGHEFGGSGLDGRHDCFRY